MKDPKYVKARNKLIPFAERFANQTVQREGWESNEHFDDRWNGVYHGEMDRLAKSQKLTS